MDRSDGLTAWNPFSTQHPCTSERLLATHSSLQINSHPNDIWSKTYAIAIDLMQKFPSVRIEKNKLALIEVTRLMAARLIQFIAYMKRISNRVEITIQMKTINQLAARKTNQLNNVF